MARAAGAPEPHRAAPRPRAPRRPESAQGWYGTAIAQLESIPSRPTATARTLPFASSVGARVGAGADGELELDGPRIPAPSSVSGPSSARLPATRAGLSDAATEMFDILPFRALLEGPPAHAEQWPVPKALLETLRTFEGPAHPSELRRWAARTRQVLEQLERLPLWPPSHTSDAGPMLARLARSLEEGTALVRRLDPAQRSPFRRTLYALERRLAVWNGVHRVLQPSQVSTASAQVVEPGEVVRVVGAIRRHLGESNDAWQRYLMLDALEASARGRSATSLEARSRLARIVLSRMDSPLLSDEQRAFLNQPLFRKLDRALRFWVTEPVDWPRLLWTIEKYEQYRVSLWNQAIASAAHIATWSADPQLQALGKALNDHYRNANVRVAVAVDLANRLLPEADSKRTPVHDELDGTEITGRSRISSRLRLFLVPDPARWRVGLAVEGNVDSETQASNGAARFFHRGRSQFRAHKMLQFDRRGIRLWRAQAQADLDSELVGIETDFDGVPLLESIARAIARAEHDRRAVQSQWLFRSRIESRITRELDQKAHEQLVKARNAFKKRFHEPMRRLALNPTPVELRTTERRMIARYRLAGNEQLAAHTPRPLAPSHSWFSMQIHDSAVNNVLQRLELDGRSDDLRTLYGRLQALFGKADGEIPEKIPQNVAVRFAPHDAIRVRFADGKVTVLLALEELRYKKQRWRRFVVSATYRPKCDGLKAGFVRDGYIRLRGYRLRLKDQLALRGIFSAVFPRDPGIWLLGTKFPADPRFQDLGVCQFVIDDAWIGLALAPKSARTAQARAANRAAGAAER